jgi:monoamine oxidase
MLIISGYQSFPTHLSHNANIKVLLNHPVTEVAFNGVKTIVKCSNGAIFDAPYVVIAVPIGVLKSKSICFIPELPQWKQEAIQKISFGNVCKVLVILKKKLAK